MRWFDKLFLSRRTRRLLAAQRRNTKRCIGLLRACQTRSQIIDGFRKAAEVLESADDPLAQACRMTLAEAESLPDEYVIRLRDDFLRMAKAFLDST